MSTNWKRLIKAIEKGKCVIFLGHGLLADADSVPLYSKLCDRLSKEHAGLISAYYQEENFFLFKKLSYRTDITNEIEEFYKQLPVDEDLIEMYKQLAQIPVNLYISVSPDLFLKKVFSDNAKFSFYKDEETNLNGFEATAAKPLLYNMFGSIEQSNSMIVSHDDLFCFLKKFLGENGLPDPLKFFFKEEDVDGEVVFLGFDFRKWYVRLLLRIFNLSKPNNATNRTAYCVCEPEEDERLFANSHFNVDFIDTKVKEFVAGLHEKCGEAGILRKLDESKKIAKQWTEAEKLKRIDEIIKSSERARKLLTEYEEEVTIAIDPAERERYTRRIKKLKAYIEDYNSELESFAE